MVELVDGIRPLSSFLPVEQRAILALVEAADAPPKVEMTPDQLAEIRAAAREAAREATLAYASAVRAARDRRATRPA
jgi:hypothetical protein